jgi:hypothetical protein
MSNKKAVCDYRRRAKEYALKAFKEKCGICGYNKCIGALEFHHLNPAEKDFGLSSKGVTRAWSKVSEELKKCVCLCANCHREVHNNMTTIPDDVIRFDEEYTIWKSEFAKKMISCPVCNSEMSIRQKYCSDKCAKKVREKANYPSDEELLEMVKLYGYSHTGRVFGVNGNSIKKRLQRRGLLTLKSK